MQYHMYDDNERSPLLASSSHSESEATTDFSAFLRQHQDKEAAINVMEFKAEFKKSNMTFKAHHYKQFVGSQMLPVWALWILRFVLGLFCVCVFTYQSVTLPFVQFNITSGSANGTAIPFKRNFYLCYLTIWSYLVITVYFLVTLFNMVHLKIRKRNEYRMKDIGFRSTSNLLALDFGIAESNDSFLEISNDFRLNASSSCTTFMLKLQWLLLGVASNAAILVTLGYFGALYPMIKRVRPSFTVSVVDLFVHGFNSVFMILEVFFSGVPIRLIHGFYTIIYGLVYMLFSIFYWIPDHTNVMYPVLLDWNNPGLTIAVLSLLVFIVLPLIQLGWWCLYKLRCKIAQACLPDVDTLAINSSSGIRSDSHIRV